MVPYPGQPLLGLVALRGGDLPTERKEEMAYLRERGFMDDAELAALEAPADE